MARRFSAEEKGKSIAGNPTAPPRIRIRAPNFDPWELIKDNCFTLVGRLTNSREQKMSSILPYLAKKRNVDPAAGSDLGRDCFQFRLDKEEEVQEVLRNRPYQFGRWMIIVQRWEPLISPSFPSQIPFWITIRGLPLHYWHEKVVRNIGLEQGELETYVVTRSSACIRLIVDGLKPLPMEPTLDFDSGEESTITLEYERLGNHCSYCFRLSHLQSQCPEKPYDWAKPHDSLRFSSTKRTDAVVNPRTTPRDPERNSALHERSFQQRVDRHGRPFGNRVSNAGLLPKGPMNKIAPAVHHSQQTAAREILQRPSDQREHTYHSPPYSRRQLSNHGDDRDGENRGTNQRLPTLQWRAKSPIADQEAMPQRRHSCSPRPSLGQNLNITDFPPLTTIQEKEHSNNVATRRSPRSQWRVISTTPDQEATSRHRRNHSPRAGGEVNLGMDVLPQPHGLPTLESVMEELNESTLQYLNVEDPVERAARQKRVLQTEIDGTVEETTARILRNSTANALADAGLAASHTTEPTPQVPPSDTKAVKPVRRRGRPARINTSRTTI